MCRIKIKNFKSFYSREWGEGGAYSCDIYFDGIKQGFFYQAGDGGCFDYEPLNYKNYISQKDLSEYARKYFKSNELARNLIGITLKDCETNFIVDLESVVLMYDALKREKKNYKNLLKKEYRFFVLCTPKPVDLPNTNYETPRLIGSKMNINIESIKAFLKSKGSEPEKYNYFCFEDFKEIEMLIQKDNENE